MDGFDFGDGVFLPEPSPSDLFFTDPGLATTDQAIAMAQASSGGFYIPEALPDVGGGLPSGSSDVLTFGYGGTEGDFGGSPYVPEYTTGGGTSIGGGSGGDLTFNRDGYGDGVATGGGSPINMTSTPVGGNFNSIGGAINSLYSAIAGGVNSVSTAITGRPVLSTARAGTAAQQQQQKLQNMLVLGGLGLAAFLIYKKL